MHRRRHHTALKSRRSPAGWLLGQSSRRTSTAPPAATHSAEQRHTRPVALQEKAKQSNAKGWGASQMLATRRTPQPQLSWQCKVQAVQLDFSLATAMVSLFQSMEREGCRALRYDSATCAQTLQGLGNDRRAASGGGKPGLRHGALAHPCAEPLHKVQQLQGRPARARGPSVSRQPFRRGGIELSASSQVGKERAL